MSKKILVIGGGPAGYVAAIRGAQLGAEVCLVEADKPGGTCLNTGCIPTKALLRVAEFYHRASVSAVPGVRSTAEPDWPAALAYKESVVQQLTGGISWLLQNHGVQVRSGRAALLPGLYVQVGEETMAADAIILATGSVSTALSFPGSDLDGVMDSTAALSLREPPRSIVIIGGGVIGMEFAALYAFLGAEVTVVEMMPEILPTIDAEIASLLREKLCASGIRMMTGARLTRMEKTESGLAAYVDADGRTEIVPAEKALVAVGRQPNTAGLGLERLGVVMDRGAVVTDDAYRTNIAGLYAVGDCNGTLMLAHAAMEQGRAVAAYIMAQAAPGCRSHIPACVYTSPEIACVGLTEQQVQEKGIPYRVGRFSLSGNGKSILEGEEGLVKVLADRALGEVLGVHMIGPHATEMIAEAVLCMNMEGTVEDLAGAVHAHPTVSEALGEAAAAVSGRAIHSA